MSIRYVVANFMCATLVMHAGYHSQYGQDKYLNEYFFKNKRNGVFVDIGAHDGITYSNSLFFEQDLGWTGLCIEPMPEVFDVLRSHRTSTCIRGCITNTTGESQFLRVTSPHVDTEMLSGLLDKYNAKHLARVNREIAQFGGSKEVIPVMCYNLNDLLKQHGIARVDYLSIDTEGGELDILKSINFDEVDIHIVDVENNFPQDTSIRAFMESKGFTFVRRVRCDEIYENMAYLKKGA